MISSLEESIATSSTNYCEDKLTLVISFERTLSVVELYSEVSTSDRGTLSRKEYKEASSSEIFKRRKEKEVSTNNTLRNSTSTINLDE